MWDHEHIGHKVVVHTAEEAGHIGAAVAAVVGPTGPAAVAGMAAVAHNPEEVAVGPIGSVVVLGLDTVTWATWVAAGIQETEAAGQVVAAAAVYYILLALALEDREMRVRHRGPVVDRKVTAAELAIRGAKVKVVVRAAAGSGRMEQGPVLDIVVADRRCRRPRMTMLSSRRAAWWCGWRVWLQTGVCRGSYFSSSGVGPGKPEARWRTDKILRKP